MSDMQPPISYTSKDYTSFRRLMLDVKKDRVPEWTSESPSDLGVALIEACAYIGDILSFYGDRIAAEAFLSTATQRRSILNIARELDYRPIGIVAASVELEFTAEQNAGEVEIPAGTVVTTASFSAVSTGGAPIRFETVDDLVIDTSESLVGTVEAVEGQTVLNERIAISDGTIDQRYPTFQRPVIHGTPRVFVDEGAGFTEWTYFHRLIDALNNQFAFTTEEQEDGSVMIIFGDGLNGRVPSEGSPIEVSYRVGGGEVGNVGPHTIREIPTTIQGIASVTNPLGATGGAEAESMDQIRINAPRALRALTRAVSLQDYASLALQVPGIAKANSTSPAHNAVILYIAPYGGGPATQDLKDETEEFFAERKLVTHELFITDPTYTPVNIDVTAVVHREFNRTAVQREVESALVGMFHFDRVDFGQFVAISHVYDTINGVDGVRYATITKLNTGTEPSGMFNLQFDPFEIPVVGEIEVVAEEGIPGT